MATVDISATVDASLLRRLGQAVEFLRELVDVGECRHDRLGNCLVHASRAGVECVHERAQRWLDTLDNEGE